MSILILDYDYLSKKNLFPQFKSSKIVDTYLKEGIIFIIPNYIEKQMIHLPIEERLNFLKSNNFKESIMYTINFFVSQSRKKIYFNLQKYFIQYLENILQSLYQNFPHDFKIVLQTDISLNKKFLNTICKFFSYPVYDAKNKKVLFFRINNISQNNNSQHALHLYQKIKNDINKLKHDEIINCQIYINFDNKAIHELKNLHLKIFENHQKFEGLEQSDKFVINDIKSYKDSSLITLEMCNKNLKIGDNDSVDVVFSKYTYHTHPLKTYEKFEVKFAWPSSNDFESFISLFLNNITIFHVTCTQEGAYFTTINPSFMEYLYDLSDDDYSKICQKFYNICYPSYDIEKRKFNHKCPSNPNEFLKIVNFKKFKYNNKEYPPIFHVQFLPWNKFTSKNIFKIPYFSDQNMSCAVSDVQKILS